MINHEYKFIYIHPPKTGGTSLEKIFINDADEKDVPEKHKYSSDYASPEYDDYFRFGTVRNPWDRAVSYFFWRKKKDLPMFGVTSFERWLEFIANPAEYGQYTETLWHFKTAIDTQANMLEGVENIIKMENFQEDFDRICDMNNMPRKELPHVNTSERDPYRTYYSSWTRDVIGTLYAEDISRFEYAY